MAIARVSNVIRILSRYFVPITDAVLLAAYDWAIEQDYGVKDLLQDEIAEALVTAVMAVP